MPELVVVAGPNGAGKSTAAPRLLGERLRIGEFVNADVIAAGLSGFAPERVAVEAGRIMLRRLRELAQRGTDFAFETTLASRSLAPWIERLQREQGYRFHLFYLWLPSAEMALARVAGRMRAGGHAVAAEDVRRRYERGLSNFLQLYSPIADWWGLYDNAAESRLIAERMANRAIRIADSFLWGRIVKQTEAREQEGAYEAGEGESAVMGVPVSRVTETLQEAVRDAWRRHKTLGYPIVIWRDGRVVVVPPEEIESSV